VAGPDGDVDPAELEALSVAVGSVGRLDPLAPSLQAVAARRQARPTARPAMRSLPRDVVIAAHDIQRRLAAPVLRGPGRGATGP
jgi:hypothetical protein